MIKLNLQQYFILENIDDLLLISRMLYKDILFFDCWGEWGWLERLETILISVYLCW